MVSTSLNTIGKIGEFINKYTGSQYNYSEPSGEITNNYQKIGEIFGFPVWMDDNKRYENEFLDFPNLGDILDTVGNSGISFDVKMGGCSVCMTISYTIPLIKYPPIIICLSKPECKKKIKEDTRKCIPRTEYEEYLAQIEQEAEKWEEGTDAVPNFSLAPSKPMCPEDDQGSDISAGEVPGVPGQCYQWRYKYFSYQNYSSGIPQSSFGTFSWNSICAGDYFNPYQYPEEEGLNGAYFGAIINPYEWTYNIFSNYRSPRGSNYYFMTIQWRKYWSDGSSGIRIAWGINIYSQWIEWDKGAGNPYSDTLETEDPTINPPPNMDNCCDDIKRLIARQEKMLQEIYDVINPPEWKRGDVQVPNCWIHPGHSTQPVKAKDLSDAFGFVLRMVDRRIGAFPQVIPIKDVDPSKEGDQAEIVVFNSMSDSLKTMFEYMLNAQVPIGATQMMQASTLHEVGVIHQLAVVIENLVRNISDYLDYPATYKNDTFPMYFNPKAQLRKKEKLEDYLKRLIKTHQQVVELQDYAGGQSQKDKINELLKKVSLIAGSVTSTKPLKELVTEQIKMNKLERMLLIKEFKQLEGTIDIKTIFDDAEEGYPSSNRSEEVKAKPYGFGEGEKPKFKKTTNGSKHTRFKRIKQNN